MHLRDTSRRVILGTQQFRPSDFASQINLNIDNAWGILRCIIDLCMKEEDGKYLLVKDPNKPVIRLYKVPDITFESDDEAFFGEGEGLKPINIVTCVCNCWLAIFAWCWPLFFFYYQRLNKHVQAVNQISLHLYAVLRFA